jgi:predicted ABC-type exoprotein transport system permease subunit
MKSFRWSIEKNELLKFERGISFEAVVVALETGGLMDLLEHPNPNKYPNQRILLVVIMNYVYLVPFIEEDDHYFLKTMIPSRKATRDYFQKGPK